MAKHDMAHILAFYMGTRQRFAHNQRAQLGGRNVFQAATKGADGGAHCADDDDFTGHGILLG